MELSDIDLNLLLSLDVLLQECNVTHAALRMNISQPALSAQLARLRVAFDDPLLLPAEKGRGMTPTAMGLSLKEPLALALSTLRQVVRFQPSFDPATDERSFHIAASDNAMVALGLPLLERLNGFSPNSLRFIFSRPQTEQVAAQFERGEIDLLIDDARLVPEGLKSRPLTRDRFLMAQRKGHPRGNGALDLDGYCALQHVLVSNESNNLLGYMDEHLSAMQRSRQLAVTLPQLTLVPRVLRNSDLVCTLPASLLAPFADDLDVFELPFAAPDFALNLAWHPRNHFDPGVTWLRELIWQTTNDQLLFGM